MSHFDPKRSLLPTLVDGPDLAIEQDRQSLSRANRSTDIDRRTRVAGGGGGFAVPEEGLVTRIGPEDLIALRVVAGLCLSDRAGTNDLPLRHGLVEARERRILGASEGDLPSVRPHQSGEPVFTSIDPVPHLVVEGGASSCERPSAYCVHA